MLSLDGLREDQLAEVLRSERRRLRDAQVRVVHLQQLVDGLTGLMYMEDHGLMPARLNAEEG